MKKEQEQKLKQEKEDDKEDDKERENEQEEQAQKQEQEFKKECKKENEEEHAGLQEMERDDAIIFIETTYIDTQNTPKARIGKQSWKRLQSIWCFLATRWARWASTCSILPLGQFSRKQVNTGLGRGGGTLGQQAQIKDFR